MRKHWLAEVHAQTEQHIRLSIRKQWANANTPPPQCFSVICYLKVSNFVPFYTGKYIDWSKRLDSSFPAPLGDLCKWLCEAESLLLSPPIPPMAELDDVKASFLKHQASVGSSDSLANSILSVGSSDSLADSVLSVGPRSTLFIHNWGKNFFSCHTLGLGFRR